MTIPIYPTAAQLQAAIAAALAQTAKGYVAQGSPGLTAVGPLVQGIAEGGSPGATTGTLQGISLTLDGSLRVRDTGRPTGWRAGARFSRSGWGHTHF